jgi:hypothetical protein
LWFSQVFTAETAHVSPAVTDGTGGMANPDVRPGGEMVPSDDNFLQSIVGPEELQKNLNYGGDLW